MEKIDRYYLEITSIKNLKDKDKPSDKTILELVDNKNYELNEFFYKQIGKKKIGLNIHLMKILKLIF